MGIFDRVAGWFETKASAITAALVGYWGTGQPVWTSVNYENLAKEGYTKCSWAFRAIDKTASACGGVPWVLYKVGRDGDEEIVSDHPLLTLLNAPNDKQAMPMLVANLVAFRQIAGQAYLEGTGDNPSQPPLELFTLRPDRMSVVVGDSQHQVGGWEYNLNGRIVPLEPFQVLHWSAFHPTDDWYGLSPLQVAARAVDQFNAGQAANVYLQQNMARPSGVLSTDKPIQDKAWARLKTDIAENWVGPRNWRKPVVLEDGLKWQQVALDPVDLDFVESSKLTAEQIVVTLGVPWVLLCPTDATFANMDVARKVFYEDTVVPLLSDLAAELNRWLVPRFARNGERLRLAPDWDQVEALQENRDAAYKRAGEAFRNHWMLRLNEARESVGWDADDVHGNRYAWEVEYLLRWGQWPTTEGGIAKPPQKSLILPSGIKAGPTDTAEAERVEAFKFQERRRAPWYKSVTAQVARRFVDERAAVLAALDGIDPDQMAAAAQAVIDDQAADWSKLLTAVYLAVGEEFAVEQLQELKHGNGPSEIKAGPTDKELEQIRIQILAYIATNGPDRAGLIQSTTGKAIVGRIQELVAAGEDASAIVAAVEDVYSTWLGEAAAEVADDVKTMARFERIAEAEVVNADGVGTGTGADVSDLPLTKEWISTRDGNVRDTHRTADGQKVALDKAFTVGGQELMHPGDSSLGATPKETGGCRCFARYDLDPDQL